MTNRDEARERLAHALERADFYGLRTIEIPIKSEDLRALLSTEEVGGSRRAEIAGAIACDPAFLAEVRDEQQPWLALHLADNIVSLLADQPLPTATPKSDEGADQPLPSVATGHPEQGALLSGWRPIESAPTDGRSVLVFCPRASDHGYERIRLTWRKDGKWQGANNTSWPPTHWMPLPSSPKP